MSGQELAVRGERLPVTAQPSTAEAVSRFVRRNHGTGHSYRLDGRKIPGVTTVIKTKAAPALVNWAARVAAEFAVDHWEELAGSSPSARLTQIAGSPNQARNKAAVRGTRIHALGEGLAHGRDVEVPDELLGPVQAYARFLDRWQITAVHTELPVCHIGYQYAGTADLVAWSPRLVDGQPFLLDVKTGRGFYRETALQLAAYRAADLALVDGAEVPMPETAERAYGAHVRPDDVEMLPVDAGPGSWRAFLHLLAVYRWDASCADDPPVGRAVWPETVGVST
jgi:phage baseplate assembly protein W